MKSERRELFDRWAARYEESVRRANEQGRFPFGCYEQVLDLVVERLGDIRGEKILEIGAGTGQLTRRLTAAGAKVTATDASEKMLELARRRAPEATFVRADVEAVASGEAVPNADRHTALVMTFFLHEFPLGQQVELVHSLRRRMPHCRSIVAGDVGFPDQESWQAGRKHWASSWDPLEHYWSGRDVVRAFAESGLAASYHQIGDHNGVLLLAPAPDRDPLP